MCISMLLAFYTYADSMRSPKIPYSYTIIRTQWKMDNIYDLSIQDSR